jgi:tetratricopeptide (TPR) repeat protein
MALPVNQALAKADKHARKGELGAAEQIYREVLAQFPANRRAQEGINALKARPRKPPGATLPPRDHYDRLVGIYQKGHFEQAAELAEQMLADYPNAFILHNLHGLAMAELKRWDRAKESYMCALALNPNQPELYNNLGIVLHKMGDLPGAVDAQKKALALHPNYPEAHNNLGMVLAEQGEVEAAIKLFEAALRLQPGFTEALDNMSRAIKSQGDTLIHRGDAEGALERFITALKTGAGEAKTYLAYAEATKIKPNDPFLPSMQAIAAKPDLPKDQGAVIHFALAKAMFDLGETGQAFSHLNVGNALRKAFLNYDFSEDQQRFADIKTYFNMVSDQPPIYTDSLGFTPVFILGMPRSGSTLTEQILASHSHCYGAGELYDLTSHAIDTTWYTDERQPQTFQAVRARYKESVAKLSDKPVIVDKMPFNFRIVGFIAKALPEAKIIHTRRSPEAICWSNYRKLFNATGTGFTCDMEDIARYYGLYEDLMGFWHQKYPGRVYDLDYELLTEDFENQTRRLLDHIGLEFEESLFEFHKNKREVNTASATQVRQALYTGSSRSWEKYRDYLKPMLDILEGDRAAPR